MQKYTVTCANPPAELKIKNGDQVRVQGTKLGDRITAKSIRNLTRNSPECRCETGIGIMVIPEEIDLTGYARSVVVGKEYIQFELQTESL